MPTGPGRVVRIGAAVPVSGRVAFTESVTRPVGVAVWPRRLDAIAGDATARRPVVAVAVLPWRGRGPLTRRPVAAAVGVDVIEEVLVMVDVVA